MGGVWTKRSPECRPSRGSLCCCRNEEEVVSQKFIYIFLFRPRGIISKSRWGRVKGGHCQQENGGHKFNSGFVLAFDLSKVAVGALEGLRYLPLQANPEIGIPFSKKTHKNIIVRFDLWSKNKHFDSSEFAEMAFCKCTERIFYI